MKKRFIFSEISKYLDHKNALVITGMRQVGKTTLMKQIYDEIPEPKLWYDFDNPLDTLNFEDINYNAIYEQLKKESNASGERIYVFIDEIQNFPEITKIIKYHIDHFDIKYIITGSSNFYLKNLFPESLSGRKFLFILYPLNFREYLYFKGKIENPSPQYDQRTISDSISLRDYKKFETDYLDFLEYGGFPEVVLTQDTDTKTMVLRNIFASFFEKDIKIISDMKDIRELRDLILMLVPRTGNILDVTKLSNELNVNRVKIYNYLELLQGVFFISLIPKYSKSIDRTVAGGRKVYFSDTGLLNIIGRVNDGQLFENAIANQLKNYGALSYYNKRNASEIDFILNKQIAFEVKLKPTAKDLGELSRNCKSIGINDFYLIGKHYAETAKTIYPMFL